MKKICRKLYNYQNLKKKTNYQKYGKNQREINIIFNLKVYTKYIKLGSSSEDKTTLISISCICCFWTHVMRGVKEFSPLFFRSHKK